MGVFPRISGKDLPALRTVTGVDTFFFFHIRGLNYAKAKPGTVTTILPASGNC